MKNLFFILVCLFISAELFAQGNESGNNPGTTLDTNQLETSESSDENADAETSEQVADEEYCKQLADIIDSKYKGKTNFLPHCFLA